MPLLGEIAAPAHSHEHARPGDHAIMAAMSYVDPSLVRPDLLRAAEAYGDAHTAGGLRATTEQPDPPFPASDNPMLRYLFEGGIAMHASGTPIETVLIQAIVHAWYEGNIEGREQQAAGK